MNFPTLDTFPKLPDWLKWDEKDPAQQNREGTNTEVR